MLELFRYGKCVSPTLYLIKLAEDFSFLIISIPLLYIVILSLGSNHCIISFSIVKNCLSNFNW